MRRLIHRTSTISIVSASLLSTSCSLQNPTQTPLHIEILRATELNRSTLHSRAQSTASNYTTAPSSLSDFDCFAVNVTAAEIAPQTPQPCTLPSDMIGIAGGWVSANTSTPSSISTGSTSSSSVSIDLMVPTGPDRLIQIYGVRTPDQCPRLGDFKSARLGDVYLIGSVTQDIFDDTDVSIKAHLDTSKKALTSCQNSSNSGGGAINLGTTTYYVLGPTSTSVTLALPNSAQYTLTSVSATALGVSSVVDAGDHSHFNYNPSGNRGIDQFTYTAVDSSGNTGTGNIVIKNVTPTTWTGEYGDHNWKSTGNWCGSVNGAHTACNNTGPIPMTSDIAYFDGTCSLANCSANIPSSVTVYAVNMDPDYPGIITASGGATLSVTNLLKIRGGTIQLNNATSSLNVGQLNIYGGSLISSASSMSLGISYGVNITNGLLDLSAASSVSLGDLTMTGGTLHAPDGGTITYNGAITYYAGTINSGATTNAMTVLNNSTASTLSLHSSSPITFQNLQIQSVNTSGSYHLDNQLIVQRSLTLEGKYSGSPPTFNGGSITVQGDLKIDTNFSGYSGNTVITLNGTSNQTITLPTGAYLPLLNVNKSGMLTINNATPISLQTLTSTQVLHTGSGALSLPTGDLNVATLTQNGTGNIVFADSTLHGDLHVQSGACSLTGALAISGTLTMDTGTTFYKLGYNLNYALITGSGTLVP